MTPGKKWLWAALVAAASAAPAGAQTGGISSGAQTGGIGLGGGSNLTSSGLSSSLNSSNISGGTGVGAGGLSTNSSTSGTNGSTVIQPPTGQTRSSLDSSNPFAGYYANPYYAGTSSQGVNGQPGGFGSPLYNSTTGTSGRTGTTAGRTGASSFGTGSSGNRSSFGSLGGQSGNQSGIVVPIPVQLNYAAQIRFSAPRVTAPRLEGELRESLSNSHLIPDGRGIQVTTDAQNNVTLRGHVRNEDEARLVEGVVRLTPGVRAIQNELTFPADAQK